jgi:hypothetical protein
MADRLSKQDLLSKALDSGQTEQKGDACSLLRQDG